MELFGDGSAEDRGLGGGRLFPICCFMGQIIQMTYGEILLAVYQTFVCTSI